MINNNLFLSLIIYLLIVCLSTVLVSVSGIVYLSFVPIILSMILAFLIISRIDRSIKDLTEITTKASRGDFSGRYKKKIDWEIEPLGIAINDLLENIILLINDYKADREELKLILGNISEALWIQNKEGVILWSSQGFDSIFEHKKNGTAKHYWELIFEPSILDYITFVIKESNLGSKEITLNGSFYLIKGISNPKTDTHAFIMQSIDLLKQTEQMKKDFMINLAHELRTPLTAIKGFSEALAENAVNGDLRYLKIIQNHTERLINLVSDLQTLAGLERLPELNLQPINLKVFMDNIKTLYVHTLEEKNLYLNIEFESALPKIMVDPFKFEQIFINLIDNALRYTEQGGITISVELLPNAISIKVCDTGKGIDLEHLPRIFERFYVTDSSRNKGLSGTGLGLAIVKHAVLLHHGTIEVQSGVDKGTCFTMNFPLPNTKE